MKRREVIQYGSMASLGLVMHKPNILFTKHNFMTDKNIYDVIIIGGSYAGLSAAMALGRSMKNVLIIDSGQPCNIQTPHAHNFITHDGSIPSEIAKNAKNQVMQYNTVKFLNDLVIEGKITATGFEVITQSNARINSKKIIFATGVKDIMPEIKGFSDCWGISVIHCPYCHGYEHKGQKTAIIANGERAFHLASLINNLTDKITILTSGKADFNLEQSEKLKKHGITIIEKEIIEIIHTDGYINRIVYADNSSQEFGAAYAAIPFNQHSEIPKKIGCDMTEQGHIKVDFMFKTSIDGVYACGDNSSPFRSIANAVYGGNVAGAVINNRLTMDAF